jgi:hypothetical protein
MKFINKILISCMILVSVGSASCERELDIPIVSSTPPALQVVVKDAGNAPVAGATVNLYRDKTAWENEGDPLSSGQTTNEGVFVFSKDVLKDPGIFYLITQKDGLMVKSTTPYLILNDGKTYFNVVLK